ncbi:hypothetical protein EOD39_9100 [Acipenser ruthenus]|uniref:Uncharacterized protein n=1 Tax=Acipenser ruthenus TaxID=7906 RepID=A0A662YXL1_ACIRT|nr:hypothetical protein EOD39_9100 [Acipenser ruthenus]
MHSPLFLSPYRSVSFLGAPFVHSCLGAERKELFELYCHTTSGVPVFPLKRKCGATQSHRPGPSASASSPSQLLPPDQLLDSPGPATRSRQPLSAAAVVSSIPRPHPPPQSPASDSDSIHWGMLQGLKALLQPVSESIAAINTRLSSLEVRSSPEPPLLHTSAAASVIEAINHGLSFTLASASAAYSLHTISSRSITISPALRKQIT